MTFAGIGYRERNKTPLKEGGLVGTAVEGCWKSKCPNRTPECGAYDPITASTCGRGYYDIPKTEPVD